jgi:vacuolar iron transporter family protein
VTAHDGEAHGVSAAARLNWLRAGVLGANDGIVSTAGIVVGVAGATSARGTIMIAGVAAVVAGALSMAVGEYVSVSSQRDAERALLDQERRELRDLPDEELAELADLYAAKGLTPELAREVAQQLTAHDAFAAHVDVELRIDPDALTSPWQASFASAVSFTVGALLPVLAILLPPPGGRVPVTFLAVVAALALTGWAGAVLGGARRRRAVLRNLIGGVLAMTVTYAVGIAVGGLGPVS